MWLLSLCVMRSAELWREEFTGLTFPPLLEQVGVDRAGRALVLWKISWPRSLRERGHECPKVDWGILEASSRLCGLAEVSLHTSQPCKYTGRAHGLGASEGNKPQPPVSHCVQIRVLNYFPSFFLYFRVLFLRI